MVNAYRPFQAREALVAMLEEQIERAKGEILGMEILGERVRGVVESLGERVQDDDGYGDADVGNQGMERREDRRKKDLVEWERRAWEALGEEEGVRG